MFNYGLHWSLRWIMRSLHRLVSVWLSSLVDFVSLWHLLKCFVAVGFSYSWTGFVQLWYKSTIMLGYNVHLGLGLHWIGWFVHGYIVLCLSLLIYFLGLQDLMLGFVMTGFTYVWNGFVVFRHPLSVMLCYDIHKGPY